MYLQGKFWAWVIVGALVCIINGPALQAAELQEAEAADVAEVAEVAPVPPTKPVAVEDFTTSRIMREEAHFMVQYLERAHYNARPVSSINPSQFINHYAENLDTLKLFFLQEDIDAAMERFGGPFALYLRQGTLLPAFEIFLAYRTRVEARVAWILNELETGTFNFEAEGTYMKDRDEAPWLADAAEADIVWMRRLKFELLEELFAAEAKTVAEEKEEAEKSAEAAEEVAEADNNEADVAPHIPITELSLSSQAFETRLQEAKDHVKKRWERMLKTTLELEPIEIQEIFLTSLAHVYDPHSNFFSADSLEDFSIAMQNSLVGIGTVLSSEDGYCVIKELIPGGPADLSNLLNPDDKILAVAQGEDGPFEDIVGMKLRKIVKLIRGKKNTTVRLDIEPADGSARTVVRLVRDEIELTATLASAQLLQVPARNSAGEVVDAQEAAPTAIGVINLPAFYGADASNPESTSTTEDVEELVEKLKAQGAQGIVLDLRSNGGGLLTEAVELAGLFIPSGPVVQVRDAEGYIELFRDRNKKVAWEGPLVILVSKFSASASEIVVGALKNYARALVVGDEATHGKGTVQAIFEMDDMRLFRLSKPQRGAAKITIQKWYLPSGYSTQVKGVPADIALPSFNTYLPVSESDLDYAMPWDAIQPLKPFAQGPAALPPHFVTTQPALIQQLRMASALRVETLEEFDYLTQNIQRFAKRRALEDAFPINFAQRLALYTENEAFKEKAEAWMDELVALEYPSEEVLLNLALEKQAASDEAHEAAENAQSQENAEASDAADVANEADPTNVTEESESKTEGNETPNEENEDAEEDPKLDILLREAARILTDWVDMRAKQ